MTDIKLENPTVGDLIKLLSGYPAEMALRIADPDTGWTISVIHVSADAEGTLWFKAEYGEMTHDYM